MIKNGELMGVKIFPGNKNLNIESFTYIFSGTPGLDWAGNINESRNYSLGLDQYGEEIDPCDFIFGQVLGDVNCNEINNRIWFNGDPTENFGWICTIPNRGAHRLSTGPFLLEKDNPIELIGAYILGRGTDPLNSVTVAKDNVRRAIQEYESNFASMTYSPPPPTNPVTNYLLYHNYPNPFNPTTTIRYELPQDGIVTIIIYDILGQELRTILNEFKQANRYEINFNATGLASGVYIYRMKVNDYLDSKKMVLIR